MVSENAILILLRGIVVMLGFSFTAMVTQQMGVAAYGEVIYVIAIANIAIAVVRWGTDETLIVSMTHKSNPRLEVGAATLLRSGLFISSVAVGGLATVYDFLGFSEFLAAATVLLLGLQITSLYDYAGQQHRHIFTMITAKFLLLLGFFVSMMLGFEDVLILFSIGSGLGNVILLALQYRFYEQYTQRGHAIYSCTTVVARSCALLAGNYVVMFASMMNLALYSLNQIYIRHSLSLVDLGIFAVQWQVCTILIIYMKQVMRIYKPILVRLRMESPNRFPKAGIKFFLALTILPTGTALLVWHLYEKIFPVLFSAEMSGYDSVFLLLVLFVFLRGIHMTLTQLCFVMSRNSIPFFANVSGAATIILFIVVMSGYSEIDDAATALNAAIGVMIVVTVLLMRKRVAPTKA